MSVHALTLVIIIHCHYRAVFWDSSALVHVDRDKVLMRLQLATTIAHAWDDHNAHYDVRNLTGIPAHIVNYVNHEKLSAKLDDKFDDYAAMLKTELDQRQMGGNLSMEFIHKAITKPLSEQIEALKKVQLQNVPLPIVQKDPLPIFYWKHDNGKIPCWLPENFTLLTNITPLAIWIQWHHGASFQDGVAVGPLKDKPPSHYSPN